MHILVINYEMDRLSAVLGWQIRFVESLSQQVEQVVVLTEAIGELDLPDSIVVERLALHISGRFARYLALYSQVRRLCEDYAIDAVFIHMAHQYAYRFFPLFKMLKLPVMMWYTHGAVSWHLRLALWSVDRVVTATPEGFRIKSDKVYSIGHGIDTRLFALAADAKKSTDLITVSRISRRKRLDLLIDVVARLRDMDDPKRLSIVGASLTDDDHAYQRELDEQVDRLTLGDLVEFVGFLPLTEMPKRYRSAALNLNVSQTNSLDKAVLEGLACGCPVLSSNPAYHDLLRTYPEFIMREESPDAIAEQVGQLFDRLSVYSGEELRALVVGHHDLESYTRRVIEHLEAIS